VHVMNHVGSRVTRVGYEGKKQKTGFLQDISRRRGKQHDWLENKRLASRTAWVFVVIVEPFLMWFLE